VELDLSGLCGAVVLAHANGEDSRLSMALSADVWHGSGSGPSPEPQTTDDERLHALVDLAKAGDAAAFGELYDHYVTSIFRFVYYRVGSRHLAEDLTADTFLRAMRAIDRFTWQGRDFGAWLTTIARNLVADHFKSGRVRLETLIDAVPDRPTPNGSDVDVLGRLTNQILYEAIGRLSPEQRDCLLMRFTEGMSIAQTAKAFGRSEGAIKQLQLRAVRALATHLPPEL
jgi:RNA polymerase sigma-70 factor (ECF subfamily)